MKKILLLFVVLAFSAKGGAQNTYIPTAENLSARQVFTSERFGVFIHWGIYSSYAQGEWYLNSGKLNKDEYAKTASGFYPANFNASEWVKVIKDAGAKYICFTTRHHDGFSMFHTSCSPYNIVDATPFGRDVVKELADACHSEGVNLHLYYSLLDWTRDDYPLGRTGHDTGRIGKGDYNSYFRFMENQLQELLTNYGRVSAIWFDGFWDHENDSVHFDWRLPELYSFIHHIQPACLIGNNHHVTPFDGEDFQMFERDLPGENKSGLSPNSKIGRLPLEMCETMNGSWGYRVSDLNYKTVGELVQLLVRAAAKGSNLLLNIGPQSDGELPLAAIQRLRGLGEWTRMYGNTVYGTSATDIPEQSWGVTTMKDNILYAHVLSTGATSITLPIKVKPKKVVAYRGGKELSFTFGKSKGLTVYLPRPSVGPDDVVTITMPH